VDARRRPERTAPGHGRGRGAVEAARGRTTNDMRYLCLVHGTGPALSPDRAAALGDLERRGHLVAAGALEPPAAGVLVRLRDGLVSVTDCPPGEHPVLAYFLLDARDLNEAIQLAARDPAARYAAIEVRPLRLRP